MEGGLGLADGDVGGLGELADLVGDDGEAAAGLAGAGGLDRGVEREQVGLVGDRGDLAGERDAGLGQAAGLLRERLGLAVDLLRGLDALDLAPGAFGDAEERRAMFSIAAPVSCVVADICCDAPETSPAVWLMSSIMRATLSRVAL